MADRIITDYEAYLFGEGHWLRAWEKMGARPAVVDGVARLHVRRLGAERARACRSSATSTAGTARAHPLRNLGASGLWETFVPGLAAGVLYKFEIQPQAGRRSSRPIRSRSRPSCRRAPASVTRDLGRHEWRDEAWMDARRERGTALDRPMAIYEVHPGSWRREPDEGNRPLVLARAGRRAGAVRRSRWASRTSSCCR